MGSWGYNGSKSWIFVLPILVTGRVPPTLLVFYLMGKFLKDQQKNTNAMFNCRK